MEYMYIIFHRRYIYSFYLASFFCSTVSSPLYLFPISITLYTVIASLF